MNTPAHWKRTGAQPEVINGHEFFAYRVGILQYVRYCEGLDIIVSKYGGDGPTYVVQVAAVTIKSPRTGKTHRFRDRKNAYRAGIKVALANQ